MDGYTSEYVGVIQPDFDHNAGQSYHTNSFWMNTYKGLLCWNNVNDGEIHQHLIRTGDRIGVLLDLDAGFIRYYVNGERTLLEFTEGVTGPLVRSVMMGLRSNVSVVLDQTTPPDDD